MEETYPNNNRIGNLNFVEIIIINLKKRKIKIKEKIYVRNKESRKNGINWIKYLNIRNGEDNLYFFSKKLTFYLSEIKPAYNM